MPIDDQILQAGKFLKESLIQHETQITETIYPEYWGYDGLYHQAVADLRFGTQGFTTARMNYTGRAANYGGKATTIPLANYGVEMDEYKTVVGVLGAEWDWQQLQAEEASQLNPYLPRTNVVASYRRALERGLREWMHLRAVFGDSTIGFTGLINNPFVEVINVASGNNPFAAATPSADAIYNWFRVETSKFRKDSKLTGDLTVAMVSEDISAGLDLRFTDGSGDGTPRSLLTSRQTSPMLRTIQVLNEFSGSAVRDPEIGNIRGTAALGGQNLNDDNFDIVMMLQASVEDNVMRHFHDIETMAPKLLDDCLTYRQIGMCATSEMIFKQPFRARTYILRK
jgi:hypothetical protein